MDSDTEFIDPFEDVRFGLEKLIVIGSVHVQDIPDHLPNI